MSVGIFPVTPHFVAEVGDVDLSRPLSAEARDAIMAAFSRYAVLVFSERRLTPAQHLEFATLFGPIEATTNSYQDDVKKPRIDERIADVSNLDHDNRVLPANSRKRLSSLANRLWHTDSSFRHLPARASLLYARSASRRSYRVCRHARRLGCAAGGGPPAHRRPDRRALDLRLAR